MDTRKPSQNYRPQLDALEDRLTPTAPVITPPPPLPDPLVLTNVAPFPVQITFLTDKEVTKAFSDKNGDPTRTLTTGALKVQVTNLDTGKSLVLNIPGPGVALPDGTLTTSGSWLFFFPADNTQGQPPGVITIHGRTVSSSTSFEVLNGHVEDIVAALADP